MTEATRSYPRPGSEIILLQKDPKIATLIGMFALILTTLLSACGELATGPDQLQSGLPVVEVQLSPAELTLDVGEKHQFETSAVSPAGQIVSTGDLAYTWSSSDEAVLTVTSAGEVTGISEGSAVVTAALDGGEGAVTVTISSAPASSRSRWDAVIENTTINGNLEIARGEKWLIGSNVRVKGNVLVRGGGTVLAMRPGSSLKLEGADPRRYVGGGSHYRREFENDIGIWVWDDGSLDIRGTPKASWNRTGSDPTWDSSDEYWIAPTDEGDFDARRWSPGQPIPRVHPKVPAAEVANVTRDVVIQGPGHIHINSRVPQRIEYVRLEGMGVIRPKDGEEGASIGRYALHFHFMGNGAAGTIVRGVAAVGSRGKVFVPHASHGITIENSVSVNSWADGLWWDHFSREEEPDRDRDDTNDLLVDGLLVLGLNVNRGLLGSQPRFNGFTLPSGFNNEIRNSAVSAIRNGKLSVGFDWVTGGQAVNPVWKFDTGNVAHNNNGPGIRFWTNLKHDHPVRDFATYRNKNGGITTGAYSNRVNYHNVIVVDNWLDHHANAKSGQAYHRTQVYADEGPAMIVGNRNLPAHDYLQIVDCILQPASGHPAVYVTDGKNPWLADFRDSGIQPSDIEFAKLSGGNDGSHVRGFENGVLRWEIHVANGRKIIRKR